MKGCKVFHGWIPLSTHTKSPKAVLFLAKKKVKEDACLHHKLGMESKDTLITDPQPG